MGGGMIFVVELYKAGANVFKTGANFITHDEPDPQRLGERIFWTLDEVRQAYRQGAGIFGEYGPAGYRAFLQFEKFLQDQNIIPKPPKPNRKKKASVELDI